VSTAIVVGGGPNGLAAAIAVANEEVLVTVLEAADEIGGGTRSGEAILPGSFTTTVPRSTRWQSAHRFLPTSAWSVTG